MSKAAEEQVLKFASLTQWRDNPKASPPFRGYPDLPLSEERQLEVDWIDSTPEEFLQACVRYKTQIEDIDPWVKLTLEQRYQRRKEAEQRCDRSGYYEPTGRIEDEEVLDWYRKEIGNRTYEQLKTENDELMQAVIKEVKRQAKSYPNHMISQK